MRTGRDDSPLCLCLCITADSRHAAFFASSSALPRALQFGGGSLVALVWTCVLVYDSISRKEWVRVCFDFSLCAFECLVACLAFSRFHDLGGFTICCGPPSRDWKGSLLVGGGIDDLRAAAMRGYGDDEETEAEPERFLNQTLLAQTTNSAHHYLAQNSYSRAPPQLQQLQQQQQQQQQAYFPARGAVAPHASFAEYHHSHAESESHLSDVSSASSSYRHTVGEGVLYGASHRSDSSAYESGVPHGTA